MITPLFFHAVFGPRTGSCLTREWACQLGVSSTAVCDSLQIGRPYFLGGGLYLDFMVLRWSNWSKFGRHKMRQKKQPPTERLPFTCGQLQLLTSNDSPQNRVTLLMRYRYVLGRWVPDSSRRQPETMYYEVFSCAQSCQPAAQKHRKSDVSFSRLAVVPWLQRP